VIDLVLQRVMDVLMAFPLIIMALAVVAISHRRAERDRRHHRAAGAALRASRAGKRAFDPRGALYRRCTDLRLRPCPIILRHMVPNVVAPFLIMLTAFVAKRSWPRHRCPIWGSACRSRRRPGA